MPDAAGAAFGWWRDKQHWRKAAFPLAWYENEADRSTSIYHQFIEKFECRRRLLSMPRAMNTFQRWMLHDNRVLSEYFHVCSYQNTILNMFQPRLLSNDTHSDECKAACTDDKDKTGPRCWYGGGGAGLWKVGVLFGARGTMALDSDPRCHFCHTLKSHVGHGSSLSLCTRH